MEINKPATILIGILIILTIVFLFAIPKYQEFSDLQAMLAKKQAEYDGASQYYAKITDIIKQIGDKQDALSKIDSSLPSDGSVAPLIYYFKQKANETGLTIKSITLSQFSSTNADKPAPTGSSNNPAMAAMKNKIKDVVFTIEMVGNYQGLKNLLGAIDRSARLFEVNAVSFTSVQSLQASTKAPSKLQTYSFKLELKTHTY